MLGEKAAKGLRPFPPRPFGRYTLLAPLASGGMGEIFLARMGGVEGFEKLVVIKKILPQLAQEQDFVDRFVTEAKILVKLHHGSVAQVLDMGQIDGEYYIALEFVDGKDLRKVAARCKDLKFTLPVGLSLFVMVRVLDALAYAHRKKGDDEKELNLVHRDISPQNVLISYEGEVKVIDFGLAKSSLASGRTNPSMILGKFFYMSPEQAKHTGVDRRSDLYAVGICLYELIAGHNPFERVPQAEIISRVANPNIEPLGLAMPGVPPNIEAIIMKALAPEQKDRFNNAEEMRGRLMGAMLELDPAAGPESLAHFMRSVFAKEYEQERKVFTGLREAASAAGLAGDSASASPAPKARPGLRPQLVPDPDKRTAVFESLKEAGEAGETGVARVGGEPSGPQERATTTVTALPGPEEFSFGEAPPRPADQATPPARSALEETLPPSRVAEVTGPNAEPLGGLTAPFQALPVTHEPRIQSSLPLLAGELVGETLAPPSSDPQEWQLPKSETPSPASVPASSRPTITVAAVSDTTPFPAMAAPAPSPMPWDDPRHVTEGKLPAAPPAASPPAMAAPAPAPARGVTNPSARLDSGQRAPPKLVPGSPAARPAAPAGLPKVVVSADLEEPRSEVPISSRPTIQANAKDLPGAPKPAGAAQPAANPARRAATAGRGVPAPAASRAASQTPAPSAASAPPAKPQSSANRTALYIGLGVGVALVVLLAAWAFTH